MADPTREQFDAAVKKVMASAPTGLSKEQFYSLIEKELGGGFQPQDTLRTAQNSLNVHGDTPEHEPDTYWGGFGKGLMDYFSPTKAGLGKQLESAAHPQTAGDFLPLMMAPVDATRSLAEPLMSRGYQAMRAAVQDTQPGIASKLSFPLRAIGKFNEALPSNQQDVVDKFFGRTGTPSPPATPTPARVTVNPPKTSLEDDLSNAFRVKPEPTLAERFGLANHNEFQGAGSNTGGSGMPNNAPLQETGGFDVSEFAPSGPRVPETGGSIEVNGLETSLERDLSEAFDRTGRTRPPGGRPPQPTGDAGVVPGTEEGGAGGAHSASTIDGASLEPTDWQEIIRHKGLRETARMYGKTPAEVADLAGIDINATRSVPVEAQERIRQAAEASDFEK